MDTSPTPPGLGQGTTPDDKARVVGNEDEDLLWPVLLDYIAEGTVIPVVGRDLLQVEVPGANGQPPTQALLYRLIAEDLARTLSVNLKQSEFDGPDPLGAVASEFIVNGGKANTIYSTLPGVLQRINQHRTPIVPEALQKLASIKNFRIFVTTTFDPLLADCLKAARQVTPDVVAYSPRKVLELAEFKVGENKEKTVEILSARAAPVVVHILGKISSTPNYVVTDEDAFEFVYSLQETKPGGLLDLLAQMKLLIIGCRVPSWLVRFFLRTARRQRLLQSSTDRTDFVVDATATEDAALIQFLRTFKTQTEVFTKYGPTQFVDELHRRWTAHAREGSDDTTDFFTPASVFISYASEDAARAVQIAEQVRQKTSLPVWLDQGRLGSGDDWARKIRRNIEGAAAVVAILSKSCLTDRGREFRREWRHALYVKQGLPQSAGFIRPLVIDDVPKASELIDEELRRLDWDGLDEAGALTDGFIKRLREDYRAAQLRGLR